MRGQSSGLVTAADKIPAIGVLFAVDYDVIVRKPCFQRGSTLKFLKNFRTFFCEISVQRHGVIISVQPIRIQLRRGGKSIFSPCFSQTFLFVLKARVILLYAHAKESLPALKLCRPNFDVGAVRNIRAP